MKVLPGATRDSQTTDSTVHVAFCCDTRYTKPLAVAVRSVIDTARDPRRLMFWLTAQEGKEPEVEAIVEMARSAGAGCELLSISAADPLLKRAPARGHITIAAYYRLYVPELLPRDVGRIIYLDSDTVVRRPIGAVVHGLGGQSHRGGHETASE